MKKVYIVECGCYYECGTELFSFIREENAIIFVKKLIELADCKWIHKAGRCWEEIPGSEFIVIHEMEFID